MANNIPTHQGVLVSWNDERGFGFIRPDNGSSDIFVHVSAFGTRGNRPNTGDMIAYTLTLGKDNKPRAAVAKIVAISQAAAAPRRANVRVSDFGAGSALLLLILLIAPVWGMLDLAMKFDNPYLLLVYPLMSIWSFRAYFSDKALAQRGKRRISEMHLHTLDMCGGWPGGYLAQRMLNHKNRKESFVVVFWGTVILHWFMWISWWLIRGYM